MRLFKTIYQLLFRNSLRRDGTKAVKNQVNLEYFNDEANLGDALAPVIYKWMLSKKEIDLHKQVKSTRHFMTVGSILGGRGFFDACVWGSGIKSFCDIRALSRKKNIQNLDIRAVRGPITRKILQSCGYKCPEIYGDPAVLLPLIYQPKQSEKTNGIGVIYHFHAKEDMTDSRICGYLDIKTDDYISFVDQLVKYDKIISSSLHGIILAEAYGIPAVFLAKGRDEEMIKYYDWYFSTSRYNVVVAMSMEEAINATPMELPDLVKMQKTIIDAFPYDLWEL